MNSLSCLQFGIETFNAGDRTYDSDIYIPGSVDMAATVVYILILIMMTDDNFVNIPSVWKIILRLVKHHYYLCLTTIIDCRWFLVCTFFLPCSCKLPPVRLVYRRKQSQELNPHFLQPYFSGLCALVHPALHYKLHEQVAHHII